MAAETAAEHGGGLKRRIGFWLLTLYGVGVMVGAGIYVLIGEVAGLAGYWSPLAFVLAGVAASATAASFAELSGRFPESAGEAAYAHAAFGSLSLSILVGAAVAAVGVVSAAAVLQGGVGYLQALLPLPKTFLIVAVGLAIGVLAIVGVAESLSVAAVFTVTEVFGLILVAGAAFLFGGDAPPAAEPLGGATEAAASGLTLGALGAASFLAFFAFVGFEDMVNMAEETRDPSRTMPRAILAAFVIVAGLYALVSAAAVYAVPPDRLAQSSQPLALVYQTATDGPAGLIAAIAVVAALNGVLAQIVMAARVGYGLGRRAASLHWLHEAHPRFGTPTRATVLATLAVILLAASLPLSGLAGISTGILVTVFLTMNIALLRLKRRGPPPPGVAEVWPIVPWAGVAMSVLMLAGGLAFGFG